jgi:alcohol dehydrogenase YqhD (iron-dependent ADH family)
MNFEFHNPTHLIFGAGTLFKLGKEVSKHGKKALIVTGGGSVKSSGIFERALTSLKDAGVSVAVKDDLSLAMEGIDHFEEFLRSIGCPTRLSELGIKDELFAQYAKDSVLVVHDEKGYLPGRPPLSQADIVEVLRSAL